MTLSNNPFAMHSGVPQPSQEPAEASSLLAPASAPVMAAPAAHPFGVAPLYTGAVSSACSSRSMRGRIAAWMLIVCQSISLVHGSIPHRSDHLDGYISRFSNLLFQLWCLMEIVVTVLAVFHTRKGVAIARYVVACIILVLSFVATPIVSATNDSVWYYVFVPEPGIYELGPLGACLLLMRVLNWVRVTAAILLVIPDFKPAPSSYVMSVPVPVAEAAPAGHVTLPVVTPEDASFEAAPKNSPAQATSMSVFAAPQ